MGFEKQLHTEMTIEAQLFKAFSHFHLLESTIENADYSRCGRTDKCVSSSGNYIALYVRSNAKNVDKNGKEKSEFPYILMLNGFLPKEIRILSYMVVEKDFSARFNCRRREYKYFFPRGNLNIEKIKEAA